IPPFPSFVPSEARSRTRDPILARVRPHRFDKGTRPCHVHWVCRRVDGGNPLGSRWSVWNPASFPPFRRRIICTHSAAASLPSTRLQLDPGGAGPNSETTNTDFQVVLAQNGAAGTTSIYLNGVLQQTYTGSFSSVAVPGTNVLTFFEDDRATNGEAVGGSVD